MIRFHRCISESQTSQILLVVKSGLKPKDFHVYVSKQVGGIDIVGYTRQDHKNFLRTKTNHSLWYGEVGVSLMYFKGQSENLSFFYDFQMDVEEQITNIFWADAQMINHYGYFDVTTFDTTYKMNKDYQPLEVFVGLNNFRHSCFWGNIAL